MRRNPYLARLLAVVWLSHIIFSGGCAGNPVQPSQVAFGEPFQLRAGASAVLSDGLTTSFDRVKSDSRCPMDALCVWAGDAVVAVSVGRSRTGRVERELHCDPSRSEATYLAYTIKLVSLAPYPRSDRRIRPGDYVATLTVTVR